MEDVNQRLAELLVESGIGDSYVTPPPRGAGLTGVNKERALGLLDSLEPLPEAGRGMVYGNACFAVGRYPDAAEVYTALLEGDEDDSAARFNLGLCCIRLRRPDEAVQHFDRALDRLQESDAALSQVYYQRGNAHDDLGQGEKAVSDYSVAINLDPGFLRAHYNRGIVLGKLGWHEEAVGPVRPGYRNEARPVQCLPEPGGVAGRTFRA